MIPAKYTALTSTICATFWKNNRGILSKNRLILTPVCVMNNRSPVKKAGHNKTTDNITTKLLLRLAEQTIDSFLRSSKHQKSPFHLGPLSTFLSASQS